MSAPRVGDRVRVTIEGEVTRHDEDSGHVYVLGHAPGHEHLTWEWAFHWATEFEVLPQREPDWWPPRSGDVLRIWGSTYIRREDGWINTSGAHLSNAELLDAHSRGADQEFGYDPPALLVRDGKPVTA